MNRFLFFICFSCAIQLFCKAPIREIASFNELPAILANHNVARTVIFIDLDDLILFPSSSVGSLNWLAEMKTLLLSHEISKELADSVGLSVWEYALLHTSFSLAREESKSNLSLLQKRGLPILGISRRSFTSSLYLPTHLKKLGIDLVSSLPEFLRFSLFLSGRQPQAMFTQGILLAGSLSIVEALETFIENISLPLYSIVCISSERSFLENCITFFDAKKTRGLYLLLPLEEKASLDMENAKFQLLSIRSVLDDALTSQIRDSTHIFSNEEVIQKIRDIWKIYSG